MTLSIVGTNSLASRITRAHLRARGRIFYVEARLSDGKRLQRTTGCDIDHPEDAARALARMRSEAAAATSTSRTAARFQRMRAETEECEACGWRPPATCAGLGLFNVHHVVPQSDGGTHASANLVVICANCHLVTHSYLRPHRSTGPRTRDALLRALRGLMSDRVTVPPPIGPDDEVPGATPIA